VAFLASTTGGRNRRRRPGSVSGSVGTPPILVVPPLTASLEIILRNDIEGTRSGGSGDGQSERQNEKREEGRKTHGEGKTGVE